MRRSWPTRSSSFAATARPVSSSRSGSTAAGSSRGMNVNVWDVNKAVQALIDRGRASTADDLRDPSVPLESLLSA